MIRLPTLLAAVIAVIAVSPMAVGADPHYEAASDFFEMSKVEDPNAVGRLVTRMVTEIQPGLRRHEDALSEFAAEVLASDAYREAQIRVFMEMFSEAELRRLVVLFGDKTFRRYRERRIELARRNAQRTMELFKDGLPALLSRLQTPEGEESEAGDR